MASNYLNFFTTYTLPPPSSNRATYSAVKLTPTTSSLVSGMLRVKANSAVRYKLYCIHQYTTYFKVGIVIAARVFEEVVHVCSFKNNLVSTTWQTVKNSLETPATKTQSTNQCYIISKQTLISQKTRASYYTL